MKSTLRLSKIVLGLVLTLAIILVFKTSDVLASSNETTNNAGTELSYEFETVSDMQQANLTKGEMVITKGFYEPSVGGAMYYVTDDNNATPNGKNVLALLNGLKAVMIVIDDKITVEQYGAHGDGISDDAGIIQAALNSGITNVEFTSKEYKCCNHIDMNKPNVNVIGNGCTLFTDNDYMSTKEWFFNVRANNIKIDGINIYAKETTILKYKTQFSIYNCSDISVTNSSFIIPATAPSNKSEYTNIDLYSAWHNITIDHCNLEVMYGGGAGGCIWIRDLFNKGCSGVKFTNNTCTKACHDEILAVFSGQITDVEIDNNTFTTYEANLSNPSVMAFTIGSESSNNTGNIKFTNNTVNVETRMSLMKFGNVDGVLIEGNDFKYKRVGTKTYTNSTYLFYSNPSCANDNIIFNDNDNIETSQLENEEYTISDVFLGDYTITNNTIILNNAIVYLSTNANSYWDSNTITINNTMVDLVRDVSHFCNNIVTVNASFKRIFCYFKKDLVKDVIIKGNEFYLNDTLKWSTNQKQFLYFQEVLMSNYNFTLDSNTVKTAVVQPTQCLCYFNTVKDSAAQTVYINQNNDLKCFTMVGRYNNLANHIVLQNAV